MAEIHRCTRVTGKAFEPHYWTLPEERQGPKRPEPEMGPKRVTLGSINRTILPRLEAVYDVLCGYTATYEIRVVGSSPTYSCDRCLSAMVDEAGGNVVVLSLKPCEEADEFGGQCVYRRDHSAEMPHRFEGGDEDARHQAALAAYQAERERSV